MNALIIIAITSIGYLVAYHTYGQYLATRIFNLNPSAPVPSKTNQDDHDFVPTKKGVIFGHHFTSIAGTGPIVGPAIGIIWGWVPALVWIFFGSIFMGAVHDFSTLIISCRNEGKSIADITQKYINPRVRTLFFIIVCLALLIVIAIFGLVIALIFNLFPESVVPVWMEIPIAIGLGIAIYKRQMNVWTATIIAVSLMYLTVVMGHFLPIELPAMGIIPPTGLWTILLLAYAFVASVLPVTTLLQPRDYINAWQLYIALGIILLGAITAGVSGDLVMVAPAINTNPIGAPPIWPFLCITIACGAISGFHALVSSGTSSKQLESERDAKLVGYGSMIIEAALATLVLVAVGAGIGIAYDASGTLLQGTAAWTHHYSSWSAVEGLGAKLNAVVIGFANMMTYIGIPKDLGIVIIGVFIASFAGTTLDTSTRIQRYAITELFSNTSWTWLTNKWAATSVAVLSGAALAFSTGANGKGALLLWPLFGAVNQLLAALALLVGTVYLKEKGGYKYLVTGIPCMIMLVITLWASVENQLIFITQQNTSLTIINGSILLLAVIITIESALTLVKQKNEIGTAKKSLS